MPTHRLPTAAAIPSSPAARHRRVQRTARLGWSMTAGLAVLLLVQACGPDLLPDSFPVPPSTAPQPEPTPVPHEDDPAAIAVFETGHRLTATANPAIDGGIRPADQAEIVFHLEAADADTGGWIRTVDELVGAPAGRGHRVLDIEERDGGWLILSATTAGLRDDLVFEKEFLVNGTTGEFISEIPRGLQIEVTTDTILIAKQGVTRTAYAMPELDQIWSERGDETWLYSEDLTWAFGYWVSGPIRAIDLLTGEEITAVRRPDGFPSNREHSLHVLESDPRTANFFAFFDGSDYVIASWQDGSIAGRIRLPMCSSREAISFDGDLVLLDCDGGAVFDMTTGTRIA